MCAPRPAPKRLAAVVVNYRTVDATLAAIGSLAASRRPVQDLIVVDNGSGADAGQRLKAGAPGATVLELPRNLGFSAGSNCGIREALARGADLVFLLNSDALVSPECLGRLEEALRAAPRAGIAGPLVLFPGAPARVASAGISFSAVTGRVRERGFGEPADRVPAQAGRAVDAVSGCAMLVTRQVFQRVGLLNEDYFFSFEDLDLCLRARRAGLLTLVRTDATAVHEGSRSIGPRSARRVYFAARNHLLLAERATPGLHPAFAALRGASIVALNLAHALFSAQAPVGSGVRGVVQGTWHHVIRRYGDGP